MSIFVIAYDLDRSFKVIGIEIRIVNAKLGLFSNETFGKRPRSFISFETRPRTIFQDSDFYSDDHFESSLPGNALEQVFM